MPPIIANNQPIEITLTKEKEYYFCTCGRSKKQPFCDGAHAGSEFTPKAFVAQKDGRAYLCQCKYTNNAPFCDGTHKKFDEKAVGKEGFKL